MPNDRATFDELATQLVPEPGIDEHGSAPAAEGLHVCESCGTHLVQLDWMEPAGDRRWFAALRCPSCGNIRVDHFDDEAVHGIEVELERGVAQLADELARLASANMAAEAERFIRALDADAIQPIDF